MPGKFKPIPDPPSLDRSDPGVMRRAAAAGKARATRENTARRKRHAEASAKHEKFAAHHQSGQLFEAFDLTPPAPPEVVQPYSADFMMAQREEAQAACRVHTRERRRKNRETIRRLRADVRAIVTDDAELLLLLRKMVAHFGCTRNKFTRWYLFLEKMKRRTQPLTDNEDLVLAWLEAWEGGPLTHGEIHFKFGDGLMERRAVLEALNELERRELVEIQPGRHCTVTHAPFCITWRFKR